MRREKQRGKGGEVVTEYEYLLKSWEKAHLLESIGGVLDWDQQTGMPPLAAPFRGQQKGLLAALSHHERTHDGYQTALQKAYETLSLRPAHDPARRNVERAMRSLMREKMLPPDLIAALQQAAVSGQTAWEEAKRRRDFALFKEPLTKIVSLYRSKARYLGFEKQPYDGLLPDFEWGVDTKRLDAIFVPLQKALSELLVRVQSGRQSNKGHPEIRGPFPPAAQEALGRELAATLGFGFGDGVLQSSAHPFSTTLGPADFRITTRYSPDEFISSFTAVAHEVGHSLYERGLPAAWTGQPIGQASSAGIHESQSLFWEKRIALSCPFLAQWLPRFQAAFPGRLDELSSEDLFRWANRVKPSLIRVDADEVTYSLHIIIRFEIEKALMNEGLEVSDIPALWDEKYRHYLGIAPQHAAEGCLQDVHWSCGAFGYFPSYALGHLFSAQFTEALERGLGPLDQLIAKGSYDAIRSWLRTSIHERGGLYDSMDLVQEVTGKPLSIEPFLGYVRKKVAAITS